MDTAAPKNPWVFHAVVSATLVSNFGTFLNMVALNVLVLELTRSAVWLGLVMGVRLVSGMIASPYLGFVSDRFDRKRLMIWSDFVLAIGVLALVFCPALMLKTYILILMVFVGVFSGLFDICLKASIPDLLGSKDTLKANSVLMAGRNFVIAASGLCAAFAHVLFTRYDTIFVLDAATYLVSGLVLVFVSSKTNGSTAVPLAVAQGSHQAKQSVFGQMGSEYAGLFRLNGFGVMTLFMVVLFFDAFASATHNVGWPVFSQTFDPEKPMFLYGMILFFWAVGNVLGIGLLNKWAFLRQLSPARLYLGFTCVMSTGMILTFQTQFPVFIACAAMVAGIGDGTYQTYFTTCVQSFDDALRGKIFALSGLFMKTGFGLGFVVVPQVFGYFSPAMTAFWFHGIVVLVCFFGMVFIARQHSCSVFAKSPLT